MVVESDEGIPPSQDYIHKKYVDVFVCKFVYVKEIGEEIPFIEFQSNQ